jgi:hypothetical protein
MYSLYLSGFKCQDDLYGYVVCEENPKISNFFSIADCIIFSGDDFPSQKKV